MATIDEKRVYGDRAGKTEVYVATGAGVVVVDVSDDIVGGFRIVRRGAAVDVAATGGRVAVATDEDVLVSATGGDGSGESDGSAETFEATGFGPAVAVGFDGDSRTDDRSALLAADDGGRIARRAEGAWETLGRVDEVRAVDRGMVAAGDGVYLAGDGLRRAGLSDVRDVAAAEAPLAATGGGLYRLGNGWMSVLDGSFYAVSAADGRAHAVGDDGLFELAPGGAEASGVETDPGGGGEAWTREGPDDLPNGERIADLAHARGAAYLVTDEGTFLADAGDGWRSRAMGLRDVAALAVRS